MDESSWWWSHQDDSFYVWMTGLFSGCLFAAADYDSCAGRDHGASVGDLLAGCAVAEDLDFEAGGGGLLDDLADGQADERGDPQMRGVRKGDGLCRGLRGSLQRGSGCLRHCGLAIRRLGVGGWACGLI